MYKLCKTEQSARRQHELEQGLLEAMLTKNYEDISISDLCKQMQVPRKSFYRYFSSKDGAFHALLDHTLQECIRFLNPLDEPIITFKAYFDFWIEKKPLLDALKKSSLSGKLVERTLSITTIDQGISARMHQNFPELSQQYVVLFIISGLMSVVIQWHQNGCEQTTQQMANTVVRLLTKPLFPV